MWKPLLPCLKSWHYKLKGSIVTNAQDIDRIIEDLIDAGSLQVLFEPDGWDAESQNLMRSPANGKSRITLKTMAVIEKPTKLRRIKPSFSLLFL